MWTKILLGCIVIEVESDQYGDSIVMVSKPGYVNQTKATFDYIILLGQDQSWVMS